MTEQNKNAVSDLPTAFLFWLSLSCVSKSQCLSYHKLITPPFSLTFFVGKESYKETASLSKKDYHLLPSLKSFFKGDGCADDSYGIVEEKTE